jgi:hypothetical protein
MHFLPRQVSPVGNSQYEGGSASSEYSRNPTLSGKPLPGTATERVSARWVGPHRRREDGESAPSLRIVLACVRKSAIMETWVVSTQHDGLDAPSRCATALRAEPGEPSRKEVVHWSIPVVANEVAPPNDSRRAVPLGSHRLVMDHRSNAREHQGPASPPRGPGLAISWKPGGIGCQCSLLPLFRIAVGNALRARIPNHARRSFAAGQ